MICVNINYFKAVTIYIISDILHLEDFEQWSTYFIYFIWVLAEQRIRSFLLNIFCLYMFFYIMKFYKIYVSSICTETRYWKRNKRIFIFMRGRTKCWIDLLWSREQNLDSTCSSTCLNIYIARWLFFYIENMNFVSGF